MLQGGGGSVLYNRRDRLFSLGFTKYFTIKGEKTIYQIELYLLQPIFTTLYNFNLH